MKNVKMLKAGQEFEVGGAIYEVLDKGQFVFCVNKTSNRIEKFRPYTIVDEDFVKQRQEKKVVDFDGNDDYVDVKPLNVVDDKEEEILDSE